MPSSQLLSQAVSASFSVHFVASKQSRGAFRLVIVHFLILFFFAESCQSTVVSHCEIVKVVCEKEEKNNHSYVKSPAD